MQGPSPATTVQWFTGFTKKNAVEKLKALKALLTPLITDMPLVEGLPEEEDGPEASLAAKALKTTFDEVQTGAEDVTFPLAQPRPSSPMPPAKASAAPKFSFTKAVTKPAAKPKVSSSDDDSSSDVSSVDVGSDEETKALAKKGRRRRREP